MKTRLYYLFLSFLCITLSCTNATNSKISISDREYIIKKKEKSDSEVMYYAENSGKELGMALFVVLKNDTIKNINITCNGIYNNRLKKEKPKEIVPISNAEQLLFIDAVLDQIISNHLLKSCKIRIFPGCLGDASFELMKKCNTMESYRTALQNLSFYKDFINILKKHKIKITHLYIYDVYGGNSDIINKFCTISDANKGKVYVADADIELSAEYEE